MIDIIWEDVAMKNILFFGDSNTYGYKPDKSGRYDYDVRWTGRIANLLGNEYNIIEEVEPLVYPLSYACVQNI